MIWRVMISVSRKHDISGFLSSQEWQLSNFCHTREGGYPVFVFRFWLQTYDLWLITKINIDEYHVISLWPKTLDRFFPALRDRREGCWVTSKHRCLEFIMPLDSSNAEGILFYMIDFRSSRKWQTTEILSCPTRSGIRFLFFRFWL